MRNTLRESVLLADFTSLRVGGPARYYCSPADITALRHAMHWATERRLPIAVLGGGTNIVFHDSGHSGLVVSTTKLRGFAIESTRVVAGAGEKLSSIAWRACRAGLSGLEWACGIPGTVGGGVVMNAGTREGEIAAVLGQAACLVGEEVRGFSSPELGLSYRTSAILTGRQDGVVTEAVFKLHPADADASVERARSLLAKRLDRLPMGASAGSIFRNPEEGPTAGELLERAGCKGIAVGGARVSMIHANIIVNEGRCNAADVLGLIKRMKTAVRESFGVELEEEVVVY